MTFCKGEGCPLKDSCSRYVLGMGYKGVAWWNPSLWDGQKCPNYHGN